MIQEQRHVYYDRELEIEAYNLRGIVQKFPNHFHEYYVVGFIEGGNRRLWCKGEEHYVSAGDMVLFNPRDNHHCTPIDGMTLDYRAININPDTMKRVATEITGMDYVPRFKQNVVHQSDIIHSLGAVYKAIIDNASRLQKEEALFFLMEQILHEYAEPCHETGTSDAEQQVKQLCAYMEEHYSENITLDDLLTMTQYGKSYLLRTFTKQIGVSPYRYLQTVRLNKSKKLLEQGVPPIEAAFATGFSDQSHFTNYFKEFIGLTPKQYQRIFTTKETQ